MKKTYFAKTDIPEGWWLMKLVDGSGMMVKAICERVGIPPRQVYWYIANPHLLNLEQVCRMAHILRTPPERFLRLTIENNPNLNQTN